MLRHRIVHAAVVLTMLALALFLVEHYDTVRATPLPAHAAGVTSLSGGRTVLPLVYYFDVEPKEQKYLKLATTYDEMVRARAQELRDAPQWPHQLSHIGDDPTALRVLTESGRLLLPSSLAPHAEYHQNALVALPDALADAAEQRRQLQALRVPQLLRLLREKRAECSGCSEKGQLIERVLEVRGWLSREDTVALALAVLQDSAATRQMLPHHYGQTLSEAEQRQLVAAQTHRGRVAYYLDCAEDVYNNGTVHCQRRPNTM